jgi:hypothetical protein
MWHTARAEPSQSGAGWPHLLGRSARRWHLFKFCFANMSRKVSAWGIQHPKSVRPQNLATRPPYLADWPDKCPPPPPSPTFGQSTDLM